jgi:hypothetical protein
VRRVGEVVLLDGALNRGGHRGVFGVGEVNRLHGLAGPSRIEAPGEDQSIIASPQTEVASGHSINDDEQRDEPEPREFACTPNGLPPGVSFKTPRAHCDKSRSASAGEP